MRPAAGKQAAACARILRYPVSERSISIQPDGRTAANVPAKAETNSVNPWRKTGTCQSPVFLCLNGPDTGINVRNFVSEPVNFNESQKLMAYCSEMPEI